MVKVCGWGGHDKDELGWKEAWGLDSDTRSPGLILQRVEGHSLSDRVQEAEGSQRQCQGTAGRKRDPWG